jgi:hypothetical protein
MSARILLVASIAAIAGACAMQRAQVANDAQGKMIGMSEEQVLSCMGPPVSKAGVDETEVWSYGARNGVAGRSSRSCAVKITMTDDRVSAINYIDPTGGPISPNEQCAHTVSNCLAR